MVTNTPPGVVYKTIFGQQLPPGDTGVTNSVQSVNSASQVNYFPNGIIVDGGAVIDNAQIGGLDTSTLTVNDGSQLGGGTVADNLIVTQYLYSGDQNTVGTYRLYQDTTTPIPKWVVEQLTSIGPEVWTWVQDFGPSV